MAVVPDITLDVPTDRQWAVPGTEQSDDAITLHVVVRKEGILRRYEIEIPMSVVGAGLVVGAPVVSEL